MRFSHLSDERALEIAVEAGDASEAHAHLEECDACRERVRSAREGWRLAVDADVPEPSPLYWEALRRRVGRAVDDTERRLPRWRFVALAAVVTAILAAIAVMIPVFVDMARERQDEHVVEAWSALPQTDEDASLPTLEGMLAAEAEQLSGCDLGSCVVALSDEEIRIVAESLSAEMGRSL
jgi:hypothetical protein